MNYKALSYEYPQCSIRFDPEAGEKDENGRAIWACQLINLGKRRKSFAN